MVHQLMVAPLNAMKYVNGRWQCNAKQPHQNYPYSFKQCGKPLLGAKGAQLCYENDGNGRAATCKWELWRWAEAEVDGRGGWGCSKVSIPLACTSGIINIIIAACTPIDRGYNYHDSLGEKGVLVCTCSDQGKCIPCILILLPSQSSPYPPAVLSQASMGVNKEQMACKGGFGWVTCGQYGPSAYGGST